MLYYKKRNKREGGNFSMFVFDISNPLTLVLMLVIMILLIFLAQEVKKSYIAAIPLFASLILILVHGIHLFTLPKEYQDLIPVLSRCLVVDFLFVGISFLGYLWIDDIEAKEKGIKRVDDSMEWFWRNI